MDSSSPHLKEARILLREADTAYLGAIKDLCGIDLLSPKSDTDLKVALHKLASEISRQALAHVQIRRETVKFLYQQECNELRIRYLKPLRWAFLKRILGGIALSPITGLVLFWLSLRYWPLWIAVAWGLWWQYEAWISGNLPALGCYCALALTGAGLCYSTFRVLTKFGFSWGFSDQNLVHDQFAKFKLDNDFVKWAMRPITAPLKPTRRVISKEQAAYESPALSGLRGGLTTHSLGGVVTGLVINVGLQLWESMSAESRRVAAQEAADRLFARESTAYEAKVAELSRMSQHAKNRLVQESAQRYLDRVSSRVRENQEQQEDVKVILEAVCQKEASAMKAMCLTTFRHLLPRDE